MPRRRSLILRDTLVFLALCGVSIALFLVTLLLFRSFEAHREQLGSTWAQQGQLALKTGHPDEAVHALRTALTYREDLENQLLLAEALAASGHLQEATNYFLNLRDNRPGDGFINLQLARLMRQQGEAQQAINDYRASIFGSWDGDGAVRRREVRFELADYLASRGSMAEAHDELLVAAGNTPETAASDVLFGDRLAQINDPADALAFYNKALDKAPHQRDVLARAGRLAFQLGHYPGAARLLTAALSGESEAALQTPERRQIATLAAEARRIPALSLSRELPAAERADHLLLAAQIAQARLKACPVGPQPATPSGTVATVPALQMLRARWTAAAPQLTRRTLERDAALEDSMTQLVNDTEIQTVPVCGLPGGDDALLLRLATQPLPVS